MTIFRIKHVACAAVVSVLACATLASAQDMKLADWLPPQHPYQEHVYGVLASKIAEATHGDVTIQVFPGCFGRQPY